MNILNLLTKEKRIAGIEINNQVIRIAYFRPKKRFSGKALINNQEHDLLLIEEPISTNIVRNGIVLDKELLGKTLKDIWTRSKLNSNYAIVSIPEDKIYSHIFPFPKTVNDNQLKEAIDLAINFQLPIKKSDAYIGYENAGDSHIVNEVLISAIPKKVADDYIESLNYAGIKVLALESHIASIARSIKLKLGQATLITKKNVNGATIFVLKDGSLRFSRNLPEENLKENDLILNESNRIKNSFESEKKTTVAEILLNDAKIKEEYLKYTELSAISEDLQSKWLIALGTAIRGEIPKGKDNHISLLPIGTKEAYAYQQMTTFIVLIRNLIIGVSIFFLFTFIASYLFIFSLSQTISKTNKNTPFTPAPPDMIQKEARIKKVNEINETSKNILSSMPMWSILLDDVNSRTIEGIMISNFSILSINDPIQIIGIAKDRETLNLFKKSLQSSMYLTNVELPIANLEQKGNIPFSMSFRLINPNMLYYK